MRQNHLLLALVAASAMRTSGQTPVQTVPVVITSDYYAQPKVLVLHALNNSGKDIVGYTFVTRYKKADGTIDPMGRVENTTDMLMKEANELIRNALADSTNDHPVAAVLTELNKRHLEAMGKPGQGFFPMDISNLQNMQRQQAYGPDKGKTERERLTEYVEDQEKLVELMTPHCHLEIALKP